ncbi:hypothetical protein TRFO_30614 [Tritrichomonas foetus]|uniref:Uncharacterized protein n=1 Tax=Tritrichomonas foetus TaxID=1144522 RepID=A0A1J4JT95_9EUKA|nr:hypothetical protein TRFO_30614 [Tritrichomonas foetus]|eukprot:OHT02291.1 hypothetical protein TRFO_30614 [Tritrichomonas foetus]
MLRPGFPLESQHPLRANSVLDKLANSVEFRARLNFEMDDKNVIPDGNRNINFIPMIPTLSSNSKNGSNHPVRIFQNDKITWVQDDIVLKTRYLFNIQGKSVKIKSVRVITPNPDGTSHSVVRSDIRHDEINNEITSQLFAYIIERHKKENDLLSIATSSELAIPRNFSIPFDNIFSEVQNSIVQLDQLLAQESSIDPSIVMASNELRELHSDVNAIASQIMQALQNRDNLQLEIRRQSMEVAAAASQIEQILVDPARSPTVPDTKNDVAFVFSLVPLVVAIAGYIMKKSK